MNLIVDTILNTWSSSRRTKRTPSGWITGNAPCCNETRTRGGLLLENDGFVFNCFNCGFSTAWKPGHSISNKNRELFNYLHIDQSIVNRLIIETIRISESPEYVSTVITPTFNTTELPFNAKPIHYYIQTNNIPDELIAVLEYMKSRKLYIDDYNFHWSPQPDMINRLIVPFYFHRHIVGYTARAIDNHSLRYLLDKQPNYVFNLDNQLYDRQYVIVCEGPIDAISIQGCALMGSHVTDGNDILLKQLNKEIILVPDRDAAGIKLVEQALKYNWSVSMPDWPEHIKDINDAVNQLGRLYTLWSIITAAEHNQIKINLNAKRWYRNVGSN
jgi:hypothetical protein